MILGIIGGVLGIPAAICAGVCAAGMSALNDLSTADPKTFGDLADPSIAIETSQAIDNAVTQAADKAAAAGNVVLAVGIIAAILAIVFGILSKKMPMVSGVGLLIATALSGITLVISLFNFLSLAVTILMLIAAIMAFVQKKEVIE